MESVPTAALVEGVSNAAALKCTACDLHKNSRVNCLDGVGPQPADLMFVGEAPGEEEERSGQPFVGPSGEVFDLLLFYAGLNRQAVRVSNCVRCRPLNLADSWKDREGEIHYGNLTPTAEQLFTCGNRWLEIEITATRPKVIVAMGNLACAYLFGKHRMGATGQLALGKTGRPAVAARVAPITSLIFGHYWSQRYQAFIVPTFHPAFLLRNQGPFLMMAETLKKAVRIAERGPGQERTQGFLASSYDDAMAVLRRAAEHRLVAYDLETTGLDERFGIPLHVGFSWAEGTGASIRLVDGKGAWLYSPDQRDQLRAGLKGIFENPSREVVGYHEDFDAGWLRRLGVRVLAQRHDVQLIYHLLNQHATYRIQSLETLAWLYTDMENFKSESEPWFSKGTFLECPAEIMGRRNCSDCDATLRLYTLFKPTLDAHPAKGFYDRHVKFLPWAAEVLHINGASIDLGSLCVMRERIELASRELGEKFCTGAGVTPFNLRSGPQLCKVLYEVLKLPVLETTSITKSPSTAEHVILELVKAHPVVAPLVEYRRLQKLLGTYVLGLRGSALFGRSKQRSPDVWTVEEARAAGYDTDGRVHASFSMVGTVTGRPSVSRPNLANQPRPTDQQEKLGIVIRQAFSAPSGWYILEGDMSQAELRILASVSRDKILEEAIASKEGVHRRTAASFFSLPVEQVTDDMKHQAKTVVFAIIYGGTRFTVEEQLWEQLDADLRRRFPEQFRDRAPTKGERQGLAQQYINAWRGQYPVAGAWIEGIRESARRSGEVRSVFGRVYRFPMVSLDNFRVRSEIDRTSVNYLIQGAASDATFMAGIRVLQQIEARGWQGRFINMMYDSLMYEVPEAELEPMKVLLKEEMERPIPELPVRMVAELEWGRRWKEEKPEATLLDQIGAELVEELPDCYGDEEQNGQT